MPLEAPGNSSITPLRCKASSGRYTRFIDSRIDQIEDFLLPFSEPRHDITWLFKQYCIYIQYLCFLDKPTSSPSFELPQTRRSWVTVQQTEVRQANRKYCASLPTIPAKVYFLRMSGEIPSALFSASQSRHAERRVAFAI
jgi:hypothetical protein